jgi:hypothetical protein
MKKTAVDYLFSKLWDTERDKFEWQSILKKVKDMEKNQIIDAYDRGVWDVGCRNSDSEKYYKETYEKK